MRKILLTTAAFLVGSFSFSYAQVSPVQAPANPLQGQYAGPFGAAGATDNNNNAWGTANTPTGSVAAGSLSTLRAPNTYATPTPGTLVIHLNGRVEADVAADWTSVNRGTNPNGTPNGYKLNPVGVASDVRLYFGADGLAASGVRYGGAIEIWQNFYGGTANSNPTAPANSASGNSSGQTLFVRKEFVYLAKDDVGIVRIGGAAGIIALLDPCIFTSQCWDAGLGNLNGGGPNAVGPQGAFGIPWVFSSQAGAEYASNKIVYLSPQVYGFDLSFNYVPSRGNLFAAQTGSSPLQNGVCNQAGPECPNVSSGDDATRWLNLWGVGLRYEHNFGGWDFKWYGVAETSGQETLTTQNYVSLPAARRDGFGGGANDTQFVRYRKLGFYETGVAATWSNLTFAFDYLGGQIDGQFLLNPEGGAPMNAWVAGVTYANGPITLGVNFEDINSQGDARLAGYSQRHETGFAFGGTYRLASGVQLVAEYQYESRHQGGFDFNEGSLGLNGRTVDAHAQGVLFGTVVNW